MFKSVVCSSFFEKCAINTDLCANVLIQFAQDNKLRIVIDKPGNVAFKKYEKIIQEFDSEGIRLFMQIADLYPEKVFFHVDQRNSPKNVFLNLARKMENSDSCFIIASRKTYRDKDLNAVTCPIFDCGNVKDEIRRQLGGEVREGKMENRPGDLNIIVNSNNVAVKSHLANAAQMANNQSDANFQTDLKKIIDFVDRTNSPEAAEIAEAIAEQLSKETPSDVTIRSLWEGLVKVVPDITKLVGSFQKLGNIIL